MLKKPDPDLQYLLWLTEVAALSPVKGVKLLEAFGTAKAVWQASVQQLEKCVKLEDNEKSRIVMRAGLELCRDLRATTSLAEGIETPGQLKLLGDYQCDYGQGYYFSKPVPHDQFDAYLKQNRS